MRCVLPYSWARRCRTTSPKYADHQTYSGLLFSSAHAIRPEFDVQRRSAWMLRLDCSPCTTSRTHQPAAAFHADRARASPARRGESRHLHLKRSLACHQCGCATHRCASLLHTHRCASPCHSLSRMISCLVLYWKATRPSLFLNK